jgi:hypothetical protein
MAKFLYKNAFFQVNSVDLSNRVESLTLNVGAETPETTAMSDGTRQRVASFVDWSIDCTWRQDFAASNVDDTLFDLVGAVAFAIEIRPDAGAVSATNPKFTGNALLASYSPLTGSVGDVASAPSTFQGDGTLTRATS